MNIYGISCYRFVLPLCTSTHLGKGLTTTREGMLLAVEGAGGRTGWGEVSPLPGFSRETLTSVIDAARRIAISLRQCTTTAALRSCTPDVTGSPSLFFGFQTALSALTAPVNEAMRVPLCALLDGATETVYNEALRSRRLGYSVAKLKVGRGAVDEDIAVVREVRRRLSGACRLRFDANRAWSFDDAARFCDAAAGNDVDYIEEPLIDPTQLGRLYERTGMPCAVDESLQSLSACLFSGKDRESPREEHLLRDIIAGAQALVWKPSLCMPPSRMALETDAPVVLSGAYESGVGTAAVLAHAAAQGPDTPAAGVDTYSRLAEDVLVHRLPLEGAAANLWTVKEKLQDLNMAALTQVWHV